MTDPTIIKKGMANKGNDDADDMNRCITNVTGIEVLINKKYTKEEAIKENAMGIFNKNNENKIIIGR